MKVKILTAGAIAVLILIFVLTRQSNRDVQLGQVKKGPMIEAVYGIGTVTARRVYPLKVGVTSTIRTLYVREGDEVKSGAPLAFIEGAAVFRAPFSGTVTSLPFRDGESVFPQSAVLTLTDMKDRYIVVSLEQRAMVRVQPKQEARISFESLRDVRVAGKVRNLYASDGNFLVNIDVEAMPPEILPGMTADVAIVLQKKENVLQVPASAIEGGKVRVKASRFEGVREVNVRVGVVDQELAEVTPVDSGELVEGEPVLVRGK